MLQISGNASHPEWSGQTVRLVVINLGSGNLCTGFPRITAQLRKEEQYLPIQLIGSLPAAPNLAELYQQWQVTYSHLCDRKQLRSLLLEDDELEIAQAGITNVSQSSFDQLCQQLHDNINLWLQSKEFLNIERHLRSHLHPTEEIRVIIETNDELLHRLPWHRWDFFRDYPKAEIALSRAEYRGQIPTHPQESRKKVRILAILSDSQGIDVAAERQFLQNLQEVETECLLQPTRQELTTQLWHPKGWDILFFAGHSRTEGETGRIYLNQNSVNHSLTIAQVEEALTAAIVHGLKLAIFNSCDGLGLALALEKLYLPTVIVMREPVPNCVAQEFFKQFLKAFAIERHSLPLAMQQARRKLQGMEDDFPGASWLPVMCQNPAVKPPTWIALGGLPPCPYRGLFAFQETDAPLFFGREQFTHDLVTAVFNKSLVAIVGSSGSGKSSIAFAGLIATLRQGGSSQNQLTITACRPGNAPFKALATAIAALNEPFQTLPRLNELDIASQLQHNPHALRHLIQPLTRKRFILLIDQFEELYTLCSEADRQSFLDCLLDAVNSAPAFTLVLTLRADFYGYALSYRPFSDALQGTVHNLGPMSREELRSSIEQPVAQLQVRLEPGLTQQLLEATWGHAGHLPLLEFALTQLWSKQQNGWLTHQAYAEIGGVEEALANHAEAVYELLSPADQQRTQQILIQLVQPGSGTDASRRLATRDEVGQNNWDLVTQLASARLVVTNCDESTQTETVEIVHEALIRSWKRLAQWMEVDREFRHWQEQLRATIRQWERSNFDPSALLRGKLLDAETWRSQRRKELSDLESAFIKQALQQQQLEVNQQKRRRQLTISGLIAGLALALSLAAIAGWQMQKARIGSIKESAASSEALFESNQSLEGLTVALNAGQRLKQFPEADLETQTSVIDALRHLLYRIKESNHLEGNRSAIDAVSFSPDGQMIAILGKDKTFKLWKRDGALLNKPWINQLRNVSAIAFKPHSQMIAVATGNTVTLWNLDGQRLSTLPIHQGDVSTLAFSPNGKLLASASPNSRKTRISTLYLWNLDNSTLMKTLEGTYMTETLAFSPDNQMITAGGWYPGIKLWKIDGSWQTTLQGTTSAATKIAFSPDGQAIIAASTDKQVYLWKRDRTGHYATRSSQSFPHEAPVLSADFSSNGQLIATASSKVVHLWKPDGTLIATLKGHRAMVRTIAFSADGQTIASASDDGSVKLWKLKGTILKTLEQDDPVHTVNFSPDGRRIATTNGYGFVTFWTLDGTFLKREQWHAGSIHTFVFSPNGEKIVTAAGDRGVELRQSDGKLIKILPGHTGEPDMPLVMGVGFSPNSQTFTTVDEAGKVELWQSNGKLLKTLKTFQSGKDPGRVRFSSDGQLLAIAGTDQMVRLWNLDLHSAAFGTLVKMLPISSDIQSIGFSPDSQTLAIAGTNQMVSLWTLDHHSSLMAGTLMTIPTEHRDVIRTLAFSPDGKWLASASADRTVKLWTLDGKLMKTLTGHRDAIRAISFSPDSQSIAIASQDGTVELWNLLSDLNLDQLLKISCNWVQDYLKTNPQVSDRDRHLCDGV